MSLVRKSYSLAEKSVDIYIFVDEYEKPWFKAKEVAQALGYKDERHAILSNVDSADKMEWGEVAACDHFQTPSNWQPRTIFIDESGLYDLVWHSKMPSAREFKRWVKCEVLPDIRKRRHDDDDDYDYCLVERVLKSVEATNRELHSPRGRIYLATNRLYRERNLYKIGSSVDVEKRMQNFNTSCPYDWQPIFVYETDDRFALEHSLHAHFSRARLAREFFSFPSDERAIEEMTKYFQSR